MPDTYGKSRSTCLIPVTSFFPVILHFGKGMMNLNPNWCFCGMKNPSSFLHFGAYFLLSGRFAGTIEKEIGKTMMKQKTRDMTQGKPAGIIVSFAIPLMLGNVFQQMYTVMDSVIVGRGVRMKPWQLWEHQTGSVTAMGGITGIAQGFSVLIAQYFGAKDEKGMKKAIAMSVWTGAGITLLFMALFLGNLTRLLQLLRVPDNIWEDAYHYLFI